MNPKPLRKPEIRSDAGRLEALYRDIEDPAGVAIIAHPLPTHGGTMHNKVVFRASKGFEDANIATLRFNFRGAGTSQGKHDFGAGEQRDFDAAMKWLISRHPGKRVFAGGFSFGSWVASRVACDSSQVDAMFLLGTPVNKYDFGFLRSCYKPMLFVHGSRDEFGDANKLDQLAGQCKDAEAVIVTGADHFFNDQLEIVHETIRDWTSRTLTRLESAAHSQR
jgi:alpha/beta superfamily hydrolase